MSGEGVHPSTDFRIGQRPGGRPRSVDNSTDEGGTGVGSRSRKTGLPVFKHVNRVVDSILLEKGHDQARFKVNGWSPTRRNRKDIHFGGRPQSQQTLPGIRLRTG